MSNETSALEVDENNNESTNNGYKPSAGDIRYVFSVKSAPDSNKNLKVSKVRLMVTPHTH
jgi:hypothetical protein